MKRFVAAALCLLLVFTFAACSGDGNEPEETTAEPADTAELKAELGSFIADFDLAAEKTGVDFDGFDGLYASAKEIAAEITSLAEEDRTALAEELDSFAARHDRLEEIRRAAVECAAVYTDAFLAVEGNEDAEIKKIGCICQLREDGAEEGESMPFFMFALAYENGGQEGQVYSTARFASPDAAGAIAANVEMFFAAEPIGETTDALKNGNLAIDVSELSGGADAVPSETEEDAEAEAEELPEETVENGTAADEAAGNGVDS